MAKRNAKQPESAPSGPPVQRPDKCRELTPEWRQDFAANNKQIADGEARVMLLEAQIHRIQRDQEFMRIHIAENIKTLGSGMNNPRLSADGTTIEGD